LIIIIFSVAMQSSSSKPVEASKSPRSIAAKIARGVGADDLHLWSSQMPCSQVENQISREWSRPTPYARIAFLALAAIGSASLTALK
jgi:hypothetical protein